MKFNVRCCCTPKIVLGVLDLPDKYRPEPQRLSIPMLEEPYAKFDALYEGPSAYSNIAIELKRFFDYDALNGSRYEEIAVFSDDRSVEFWRQFGNRFEEGKELPRETSHYRRDYMVNP